MATPKKTLWELDPHTVAKHEILRRYLKAWFPILNQHHGRVVYIDGFCGPGRYIGGEPGSPLVALDAAAAHGSGLTGELMFWFIDERSDRIDHLRQELDARTLPKHFKVHPECGRFDDKFKALLDHFEATGKKLAPTFAFVDPFGFSGIPFSLLKRYLSQQRCEAFITFMVDSLNRFLDHPVDEIKGHITETFGTDEALSIARGGSQRVTQLKNLYQKQLGTVARFVRYFEMRDKHDRVQYYLFFAGNHELGHLKMKEAMWGVDPDGTFRFSDATVPDQKIMFEADPAGPLLRQMREKFLGAGTISGSDIRQFVERETPFLKKHMTEALKKAESQSELEVEQVKSDGKNRIANSYPDEARITFVKPPPKPREMFGS